MARKSEKNQYFTFERDGKTLEQSELANVLNSFTHQLINYIPALDITTLPVFFPADEPAPIVELHEIANVYPDKPFHVSRTRKKELDNIESLFSAMTDDDEDVVRTVFLTGQPGSGKTELARQYGDQFIKATSSDDTSKPLVITLNANSEESLLESVKEATRKLPLPVRMELPIKNLEELMKNLRDYFRNYSGAWLLIIDDMFEKNDFNKLFPRPGGKEWGGGQVLVTTQDNNLVPACHPFAKKLSLNEGMTKEDALALLKEISDVEVDDFAEEIIKELQRFPLALACCAIYVGETRQDRPSTQFRWKEYLDLYRQNAKLESRTFSKNNVYRFPMTTAITMAVKRMAETSDVLRLTFSFLSYCALLPVPLNVLAHHVKENLPVQSDKQPKTKEEIGNEISRCTLLVHGRLQNVETIKCHQFIHNAFQSAENTKPVEQRKTEFVKMMRSLTLNFTDNTYEEDVLLKVLVWSHVKSFVDYANDMSWNDTAEFVLISMKKDQFLFSTADISDEGAIKSLELLYDISLNLDLSKERRCDILANLGFYYLELDRHQDALNFLHEAYSMTEDKIEEEWLLLRCRVSFYLARTYHSMDSVGPAVEMMKTSINLAKKVYIKEEDKIMERFFLLAMFYQGTWSKFWKLEGVLKQATEFLENCTPGPENLSRARCLANLSYVYAFYGNTFLNQPSRRMFLKCANLLSSKSLNIFEQVLGEYVSFYPEYYNLLAQSAIRNLEECPAEARTQLDKALECCIQNGDEYTYGWMAVYRKYLFDNSSWWQSLFYWIRDITRGHVLYGSLINSCDDFLKERSSKKILYRRVVNTIKREKRSMYANDCEYCKVHDDHLPVALTGVTTAEVVHQHT
ncbi:Myotubularin-related 14 [Paramuricea clavata]|uniref:Myotubularin-related 14 n=1 Tax=Paramuricea clavata TaxID=317549 RepID=A0A6S7GJJ7_PARCT|nr:Myotubularin-related 14 [Paramuricea clavata]